MEKERCAYCRYNLNIVEKLKNTLPDDGTVARLSEVFKVFADATRIKILWTLFDSERCVYDIAAAVGMTQSAVSHQLRVLKQARLVKSRRDGKNTFYSLDDDHVKRIIEQGMIHMSE